MSNQQLRLCICHRKEYMAYTKPIEIDFNKIIESNSCGPFKIIEDLGRDERSRLWVKVKFLNTGTEKKVRYDIAMDGRIRDDLYGIDFNKIYQSIYYGPYKVISYEGRNRDHKKVVKIRFLNTGYEYIADLRMVLSGQVRDYSVSYYDRSIGCEPHTKEYDEKIEIILLNRWKSMMDRCYNPNNTNYYKYGEIGVSVCEYWHNFENYKQSMPTIRNYDKFYLAPQNYQLDKDYLQLNIPIGNRIYSPQTCVFLSLIDNANLSVMLKPSETGYYGVKDNKNGTYTVEFSVEGQKIRFGTYSNLTAAVNEYNFYYLLLARFQLVPLLNTGFERMTHSQAQQYLVKSTDTE